MYVRTRTSSDWQFVVLPMLVGTIRSTKKYVLCVRYIPLLLPL